MVVFAKLGLTRSDEIPAVLLELRRGSCMAPGAAECPAWLSRQGRLLEAARKGSAAAQTKWGIQLTPGAAVELGLEIKTGCG